MTEERRAMLGRKMEIFQQIKGDRTADMKEESGIVKKERKDGEVERKGKEREKKGSKSES